MHLFDTDHLGMLQQRALPECQRIIQRMRGHPDESFFVSIISFHEQVQGWNAYLAGAKDTAGAMRAYSQFERILADFSEAQLLSFDKGAGDQFDQLKRQRIRVGTMDLRIAAIALANNLTLLTRNLKDFAKVPGLQIEDWSF